MKHLLSQTRDRARELRLSSTDAETALWKQLRGRRFAGLKFRRQHPLGGYVLDFYCEALHLAIELDGGQHGFDDQAARDARRTRRIEALGIDVIRFTNTEVLTNLIGVLEQLLVIAEEKRGIASI